MNYIIIDVKICMRILEYKLPIPISVPHIIKEHQLNLTTFHEHENELLFRQMTTSHDFITSVSIAHIYVKIMFIVTLNHRMPCCMIPSPYLGMHIHSWWFSAHERSCPKNRGYVHSHHNLFWTKIKIVSHQTTVSRVTWFRSVISLC